MSAFTLKLALNQYSLTYLAMTFHAPIDSGSELSDGPHK